MATGYDIRPGKLENYKIVQKIESFRDSEKTHVSNEYRDVFEAVCNLLVQHETDDVEEWRGRSRELIRSILKDHATVLDKLTKDNDTWKNVKDYIRSTVEKAISDDTVDTNAIFKDIDDIITGALKTYVRSSKETGTDSKTIVSAINKTISTADVSKNPDFIKMRDKLASTLGKDVENTIKSELSTYIKKFREMGANQGAKIQQRSPVVEKISETLVKPKVGQVSEKIKELDKKLKETGLSGKSKNAKLSSTARITKYIYLRSRRYTKNTLIPLVKKGISSAMRVVGSGLQKMFNAVLGTVMALGKAALNGVMSAVKLVGRAIHGIYTAVTSTIGLVFRSSIGIVGWAFNKVGNSVMSLYEAAKKTSIVDFLKAALLGPGAFITGFIVGKIYLMIFGKSGNLLAGMIAKLKEGVNKAVEAIEKKIGDEYESMKNAADPIVQDVKTLGMEIFNDIADIIEQGRKLTEGIWSKISPVAKTIKSWYDQGWFGKIKEGIKWFVMCTGGVGGAICRRLPGIWKFVGYIVNAIFRSIRMLFSTKDGANLIIKEKFLDMFGDTAQADYFDLVNKGRITKETAKNLETRRAEVNKEFAACDLVTNQWDGDIRDAFVESGVNPLMLDKFLNKLFIADIFGTKIDYGNTKSNLYIDIPGVMEGHQAADLSFRSLFETILSNVKDRKDAANLATQVITGIVNKRLDMIKLLSLRLNDVHDITTMTHLGGISEKTIGKYLKDTVEGRSSDSKIKGPGTSQTEEIDLKFLKNITENKAVIIDKTFWGRVKSGENYKEFNIGDVINPDDFDIDVEALKKQGLRVRADGKILIDDLNARILDQSRKHGLVVGQDSGYETAHDHYPASERRKIMAEMDKAKFQKPETVHVVAPKPPEESIVPEPEVPQVQEEKREKPKVDVVQPPTEMELYTTYKDMQTDIDDLIKEIEEENKKPENQTVSVEVANAAVKAVAEEAKKTVAEELPKIQYSADETVAVDPYLDDPDNADDIDKMKRALRNMAEDREKNGVSTPHRSATNWNGTTIIPFNVLEANRHWEGGKFGAGTALETNRRGTVGIRIR